MPRAAVETAGCGGSGRLGREEVRGRSSRGEEGLRTT